MTYMYQLGTTKGFKYFEDLFKGYPDPTYLTKLTKLNRPTIKVYDEGKLIAFVVLCKRDRAMKLCLMLVHRFYTRQHIGLRLMHIIRSIFNDEFNDVDTLYTVCPHQFNTDAYQQLLIRTGFQVTTVKANGDIVYTYAKSIQESN